MQLGKADTFGDTSLCISILRFYFALTGFITIDTITALDAKAEFLAVNTQVNSGNRGHHVIHRYPMADFVSLNEPGLGWRRTTATLLK